MACYARRTPERALTNRLGDHNRCLPRFSYSVFGAGVGSFPRLHLSIAAGPFRQRPRARFVLLQKNPWYKCAAHQRIVLRAVRKLRSPKARPLFPRRIFTPSFLAVWIQSLADRDCILAFVALLIVANSSTSNTSSFR